MMKRSVSRKKRNPFLYATPLVLVGVSFFLIIISLGSRTTVNQTIKDNEGGAFLKEAFGGKDAADYLADVSAKEKKRRTAITPSVTAFQDIFSPDNNLEETGAIYESNSPNWWVNSGAWLIASLNTGKTVQGDLSVSDRWYTEYLESNPIDTDSGLHPQNIFRLVQTSKWKNLTQEAYFKINHVNLSESPNRNVSNGLFLFNRYQTGDNLYYTGLRVDGYAVIKKKINGTYYTLAYKPFIVGSAYDRDSNPTLLPKNTWLGLRSEVTTNSGNTVNIKLFVDNGRTGNWVLATEAKDDGKSFGGGAILNAGYAGIRTDFMDVEFDDYKIVEQ